MQEKTNFLNSVTEAARSKLATFDEVVQAYNVGSGQKNNPSKVNFNQILSYIGGLIVFLGISFTVGIIWESLGDIGQILVTLGSGMVAYVVGNLLIKSLDNKMPGVAIHLVGGLLIPSGILVALSKLPPSEISSNLILALVFLLVFGVYLITDIMIKANIFTLFSALFGSASYLYLFNWLIEGVYFDGMSRLFASAILLLSSTYILFGKWLEGSVREPSGKFLFGLGVFTGLGSLFGIVVDYVQLEFLYLVSLFGVVYLSTYLKSRTTLIFSIIYLIVTIFYISFRYFADTLTWPIALIISGLSLIAISYWAIRLDKKMRS